VTSNRERDDTEGLADLSEYSLAELLTAVDNPVLASSLKRVVAEDDESNGIVAGFQSAI
jgi:FXSXX-COOH protein